MSLFGEVGKWCLTGGSTSLAGSGIYDLVLLPVHSLARACILCCELDIAPCHHDWCWLLGFPTMMDSYSARTVSPNKLSSVSHCGHVFYHSNRIWSFAIEPLEFAQT